MFGTTHPRTFSRYPMLWLAIYFACGIVLGHFVHVEFWLSLFVTVFLAALCIVKRNPPVFLLPLIFVSLGSLCGEIQTASIAENRIKRIYDEDVIRSGEPVEIEGILRGLPEPAYGGMFLLLQAERLTYENSDRNVVGMVRLFVPASDQLTETESDQLDLGYGSRITVFAGLERDERFRNPGVASRIEMLDQQGIDATATIKSPLLIEKLGDEPVFLPLAWIYEQRQRLIVEFREHFSAPTAGVMIASLLGDKHFLDRQTSDVFRDGGTFHVLVISGLHITFIGGLTLWFLSSFSTRRPWHFVFACSFLWAYTLAVGAEVPVVRASLMFTVLIVSRMIYRSSSLLNALGVCMLLLLVWRPGDLFSASFQLTVASVAAIVGCAFPVIEKLRAIGTWMPTAESPLPPSVPRPLRRFCELLYWNDAVWKIENGRQIWSANLFKSPYLKSLAVPNLQSIVAYVFEGVVVSAIVQAWMLPLLVIYFHRVSPSSVLLNLWVGVFLALESFAAIIAVTVNTVSVWLAAPLIAATEVMNRLMMFVPSLLSENRLAGFRLPVYPGFSKIIYAFYGVAVVAASVGIFKWEPFSYTNRSRSRWLVTAGAFGLTAVLGVAIILHPFSAPSGDGKLKVDFLDVGQGDSALVTFPNGETMLVDGGGRPDYRDDDQREFEPDVPRIGESVVSEFLWEKGYSRLDYIVATHADADHIQGLTDVARNFQIGTVLVGNMQIGNAEFDGLLTVIESREIPFATVRFGDELSIGGTRVEILNPRNDSSSRASTNNSSVVMKISYGSRAFLLTGDIELETEAELLRDGTIDLRSDVIKVPHHGSRTSSTENFIGNVGAEIAVISVGRKSPFGHPHPEVLSRWRKSGAGTMTTGEKGTITITMDGNELRTQTFVP